jgi:hypothetical protein
MAASAQDNSKSAVPQTKTRTNITGLYLDGGFGSGQFKYAAPPQTQTNTKGKEGWNITGLHLDGGFGSGQFMCAAPTKQTKGWDTGEMEGTQCSHRRHMRQTFGMDGGEGKHMA